MTNPIAATTIPIIPRLIELPANEAVENPATDTIYQQCMLQDRFFRFVLLLSALPEEVRFSLLQTFSDPLHGCGELELNVSQHGAFREDVRMLGHESRRTNISGDRKSWPG